MMISDRRENNTSNNINNRSCRRSMRRRRRSYVTNAKNYLACDQLPSPQHDTARTSSWKSSLRLSHSPWAPPRRSPSSSTVGRHTDGGPRLNKTDLIPQRTNFRPKNTHDTMERKQQFQFACSRFRRSLLLRIGVFGLRSGVRVRYDARERCKWSLSSPWRLRELQGFRDDARRRRVAQ